MRLHRLLFERAAGYRFTSTNSVSAGGWLGMQRLKSQVSQCNLCELCKQRKKAVVADGATNIGGVMIVGEYPSADDDFSGEAQMGELQDILNGVLSGDTDGIYRSYLLKCRPRKDIKDEWFKECADYFEAEFKALMPKLVVALGEAVFRRLSGDYRSSFGAVCGGIFEFRGTLMLVCDSPQNADKNPSLLDKLRADLSKIKGYL